MSSSPLAPIVLHGWYALHQFVRLDPNAASGGRTASGGRAKRDLESLAELVRGWEAPSADGWSAVYRIVGGGTDYMLLHFRSSIDRLADVERTLQEHPGSSALIPTGDYLSVIELGLHTLTASLVEESAERGVAPGSEEWDGLTRAAIEGELEKRYVQGRLRPTQPEHMPYVCFYPMDKRRTPGQNWYTLPIEDRAAIMRDHGKTGRTFAGRISQIITGSIGLDDWEWAVTLFSADPLEFKALVTEMRYDPATSVYSDFGSFRTGYRIQGARLAEEWTRPD